MNRDRAKQKFLLTPREKDCYLLIAANPRRQMPELAVMMGVSRARVTQIVHILQDKGWIGERQYAVLGRSKRT